MPVACFCGHTYDTDDGPACPSCGAEVWFPKPGPVAQRVKITDPAVTEAEVRREMRRFDREWAAGKWAA